MMDTQLWFTEHALDRCAQRNITEDEVAYIIRHGRKEYNAGVCLYYLGKRDIPKQDRSNQRIAQLEGAAIMTRWEGDGFLVIITLYRNRKTAWREFLKRDKYLH